MNRRLIGYTVAIALGATLLVTVTYRWTLVRAQARTNDKFSCSASTIRGPFGFSASGVTARGLEFSSIGRLWFDGTGNWKGEETINAKGTLYQEPMQGRYVVSPECVGNMTLDSEGGSVPFNLIVDDEGNEIRILETEAKSYVSGLARRQSRYR